MGSGGWLALSELMTRTNFSGQIAFKSEWFLLLDANPTLGVECSVVTFLDSLIFCSFPLCFYGNFDGVKDALRVGAWVPASHIESWGAIPGQLGTCEWEDLCVSRVGGWHLIANRNHHDRQSLLTKAKQLFSPLTNQRARLSILHFYFFCHLRGLTFWSLRRMKTDQREL